MRNTCIRALLVAILALAGWHAGIADSNIKTVTGTATYIATDDDSRNDCLRKALELARIDALSREFGTSVGQNIYSQESNDASYTDIITNTEVNGEWISDDGEPTYEFSRDPDHRLIVTCTIKGKAKRLTNEAMEFESLVLNTGNTKHNAGTSFSSGDNLYLYFKAPADGFLTVYLVDDEQNAFSVLPYIGDTQYVQPVKKNKEYVFFDPTIDYVANVQTDGLIVGTEKNVERDRLYVIFSPNKYNKAPDRYINESTPRMLSNSDFQRWLNNQRRRDAQMSVKEFTIEITR